MWSTQMLESATYRKIERITLAQLQIQESMEQFDKVNDNLNFDRLSTQYK